MEVLEKDETHHAHCTFCKSYCFWCNQKILSEYTRSVMLCLDRNALFLLQYQM